MSGAVCWRSRRRHAVSTWDALVALTDGVYAAAGAKNCAETLAPAPDCAKREGARGT